MALVPITGNAWDHQGKPIPATLKPELWFKPKAHAYGGSGLLVGVEAKATLNATTGAFTCQVVSEPGIFYQPVMRWLLNPGETDMEKWSWGYAEWPFLVTPGKGGPISDLINVFTPGTIIAALGPPLPTVTGVVWVDLNNQNTDGALVYAPEGSF